MAQDARNLIATFGVEPKDFCNRLNFPIEDYDAFMNGGYQYTLRTMATMEAFYIKTILIFLHIIIYFINTYTMTIELITEKEHDLLMDIYTNVPELFLQNNGYEGINKDQMIPEAIKLNETVNCILRKSISGFSSFQNFRKDNDGNPQIRFQYNWSYDGQSVFFIGVGYILISELLNGFEFVKVTELK
jgi:hypothetical protein